MIKKTTLTLTLLLFAVFQTAFSANINITTVGTAYSPSVSVGAIGDVVTIAASSVHPLVQVDQTNWNANSPTPMVGGWGTKTASYTFTITTVGDIYYGCANHMASMGMKGMISVPASGIMQATASAYNISAYPNPVVNGEFTVKAEGYNGNDGKILLYSEEGKLMETHNLTGAATLVKTKLPAGVYFYTVMIGNKEAKRSKFLVAASK